MPGKVSAPAFNTSIGISRIKAGKDRLQDGDYRVVYDAVRVIRAMVRSLGSRTWKKVYRLVL